MGKAANLSRTVIEMAKLDYLNSKDSLCAVGKKYGVSGNTIRNIILESGNKVRGIHEANFSEERIKECCSLYVKGESSTFLAKKYSVTRRTIAFWLNLNGIKPKTFQEKLGVTEEIKKEARRMYSEENLNCVEISKILKFSGRSIYDWVFDIRKTKSELASIRVSKGKGINKNGVRGEELTPFGTIRYDSSYERDRIRQLCSDENISFISRCRDRIPYIYDGRKRHYNPDLTVIYNNGLIVVEEIKPSPLISYYTNPEKAKNAKFFYFNKNIHFRIITEVDIYKKN